MIHTQCYNKCDLPPTLLNDMNAFASQDAPMMPGAQAFVSCETGYVRNDERATCQNDGTWQGTNGTFCKEIRQADYAWTTNFTFECKVKNPANNTVEFAFKDEAQISFTFPTTDRSPKCDVCDFNYYLNDANECILCPEGFASNGGNDTCRPLPCNFTASVANSITQLTGRTGDAVPVICEPGYSVQGDDCQLQNACTTTPGSFPTARALSARPTRVDRVFQMVARAMWATRARLCPHQLHHSMKARAS